MLLASFLQFMKHHTHTGQWVQCELTLDALQDVAILDVRGSVKTRLQSTNAHGCRLEMSEYFADYDTYLEGHIPGEALIVATYLP